MSDEDRIREIEEVLNDEAQRDVKYDDKHHPVGWSATTIPIDQPGHAGVGPLTGTGATKVAAAEALLAEWRKRVAEPQD